MNKLPVCFLDILVCHVVCFMLLQPAAAAKPMGRGAFLQQVLAMQQGGAAPTQTSATPASTPAHMSEHILPLAINGSGHYRYQVHLGINV